MIAVSIVIPTRNRAKLLKLALNSIVSQTLSYDEFEVIVVDNGSTDQTCNVAKSFKEEITNFKYIYDANPGLHVGRHRGMLESTGDILVYADDDIEAFPSWLESVEEAFQDPNVAMVGGNNLPMFLEAPPKWLTILWKKASFFYGYNVLPALSILQLPEVMREFSPHYVWGCNFAIRKSVLLDAGGFHPDGMPQELIRFRGDGETHVSRYVAETGLKCMFHPGATVYHKVTQGRMTKAYFRQRGFNQGISDSYTALRNQDIQSVSNNNNLFKRTARWLIRQAKERIHLGADAREALSEMKYGHREGYAYHQNCYQKDSEVRAWVHKEKYYEESA